MGMSRQLLAAPNAGLFRLRIGIGRYKTLGCCRQVKILNPQGLQPYLNRKESYV
jgi:hypothetical protein